MRSTQRAGLTSSFLMCQASASTHGDDRLVEVFRQVDADHYERLGRAATGPIAKTTLLVPELKRFYAAIPKLVILRASYSAIEGSTIEEAKILVYDVIP